MNSPNIPLLLKAYAFYQQLPEKAINLNLVVTQLTSDADTDYKYDTICCGMGWLALHPEFNALGLSLDTKGEYLLWQGKSGSYLEVACEMFDLTLAQSVGLFESVSIVDALDPAFASHKQELLRRFDVFFTKHGVEQ